MADTVEIRWEAEDGYAGPAAPQYVELHLCDFEDLPDDEIERLVEDCITEDFEQKVSWTADIAAAVEAIKKALARNEAEAD